MENVNQEMNIDMVSLFVKNNREFYKRKFEKMEKTGKSTSWNWAAFLFGIYWMVYRKMYFKAAAFFVLSLVASYTPYVGTILNFVILVGIGIYANALYLDHIEGNIKSIEILFPENKEEMMRKKGGTNLPVAMGIGAVHQLIALVILVGTLGLSM